MHISSCRRVLVAALAALALLAGTGYLALARPAAASAAPLSVQYKTTATGGTADEAEPWFTVTNTGSSSVPLNEVTLRYYFTADGAPGYTFACAWAVVGCANVSGTVVAMSTTTSTADHYLQIGFAAGAGSLAPGGSTGDIQLRLYRSDWQTVDQADDYSFGAQSSYADWTRVASYLDGTLASGTPPVTDTGSPSPTPTGSAAPGPTMFDDFDYSGPADPNLGAHDWAIRTSAGGPGVSGATWSANAFSFPTVDGNKVMQMAASTDGTAGNTVQAEIDTVQRKFFEGTYAARVYFNDAPSTGPNGDAVNETFYTITPDEANYSELDYEYLPNGGWGAPGPSMYTTTWYSADAMDRQSHNEINSLQGWHTLAMTVSGGTVTYYIDGSEYFSTTGKYYPRDVMTIDFNEWFIDGELAGSSTPRTWTEQVDWVYYTAGSALTTDQVDAQVDGFRAAGTSFTDTVPAS